jgi:hypothetical protein
METPLQTATRLLTALEDLTAQESVLLRTLDFVDAVALQERAAPLVDQLAVLAGNPEVARLRGQVAAIVDKRQQSRHFLDAQLARLQSELRRIDEARSRLSRVAPAYVVPPQRAVNSRLNTAA